MQSVNAFPCHWGAWQVRTSTHSAPVLWSQAGRFVCILLLSLAIALQPSRCFMLGATFSHPQAGAHGWDS